MDAKTPINYLSEENFEFFLGLVKAKFKEYFTKEDTETAITNAIADVRTLEFKKVDSLPETGESKYIYLVPSLDPSENDIYNEYIWITEDSGYEFIGTTKIDLTGYLKDTDLVAMTDSEIEDTWNSIMNGSEDDIQE